VTLKLWGRERWGRDFVREARSLLALVMGEFRLVRLDTLTADPRVVTMARLSGFSVEGVRPKDFKWNGEYHDTTIMGLVREG
jgi:RimJ/RimL family protein N-acetyltransferase